MTGAWSVTLVLGVASGLGDDEAGKSRVAELEARILRLEEGQAAGQDEAKEKPPVQEDPQERKDERPSGQAFDDKLHSFQKWLTFSSPDGQFTAKVGGRIYFIYRHVFDRSDAGGTKADAFDLDTARIQLDGTFLEDFFYRVETEAAKNSAHAVKDTYLGWKPIPELSIQGGQFKEPFSQEETTSSRFIDFAERSLVNQLVPGRDIGVMAKGGLFEGVLGWEFGVFNGAGANSAETNDEKDVAGRLQVFPLKNEDFPLLEQIRLGVAGAVGDVDDVVGLPDYSTKDYGGLKLIDQSSTVVQNGLRTRYGFEFSWLYGPFSLRAEYVVLNHEILVAGQAGDYDTTGWYVQATYLLTGEAKPLENRVRPGANLDLADGGWGAWELAVRYAEVDVSDGSGLGVVAAGAAEQASQIGVALSWWWTSNVRMILDYEHFMTDEDLVQGADPIDHQDVIYARWQIDF